MHRVFFMFRPVSLIATMALGLAVCLLSTFVAPVVAFALATDTTVPVGDIYSDALPYLYALAAIVVSLIVGWLTWGLNRLLGVSINAKMSQLLHDTLLRGAQRGLDAIGKEISGTSLDMHSQVIATAIRYVRTYRPDLLKHFGLTDAQLADMIRVHLSALTVDAPKVAAASAA